MADRAQVLIVADWTVDPQAVVGAARARYEREPCSFALLVPARLHGLDWAGDPRASLPCARQATEAIAALARAAPHGARGRARERDAGAAR